MNPEQISTTALEPFIRKFILAVIQNIKSKNFSYEQKYTIHADLIPKVSKKIAHTTLKEKKFTMPQSHTMPHYQITPSRPIEKKLFKIPPQQIHPLPPPKIIPQKQNIQTHPLPKPIFPIPQPENISSNNYGRIEPLLYDPSVSSIECQGVDKPILVIRAGQKQITKISLTKKEIDKILDRVSEKVHIPILEGVFRAVTSGFSISAVISEVVGTKFIIKKATPYAMFEH